MIFWKSGDSILREDDVLDDNTVIMHFREQRVLSIS